MGARRDRKMLNPCHILALILAFGVGFPGAASATQGQLPAAYTSLASFQPTPSPSASNLVGVQLAPASAAAKVRSGPRFHKFMVLDYSRSLVVGKEDVIVRLQSPGKRKSIMMLELKF